MSLRCFSLAGREIRDDSPCYVIAECGNNHQGDAETALRMVDAAADCGADAVKFQRRHNPTLYSRALLDKPYDNPVSFGATYGAHRAALELPLEAYPKLIRRAHSRGLACLCTAFDEVSATELASVGIDGLKVASGGLTDGPLLAHVHALGLPVLISTGGGTAADVEDAAWRCPSAALMHCTAAYPADFAILNLRCLKWLRAAWPTRTIGWSGHDNGIAMSLVAYDLGARILEKHFTLDRAMKGTDHAFSLEPVGLRKLCRDLKRAHVALGDGVKRYYAEEVKPIAKMRRRQVEDGVWQITGQEDACSR